MDRCSVVHRPRGHAAVDAQRTERGDRVIAGGGRAGVLIRPIPRRRRARMPAAARRPGWRWLARASRWPVATVQVDRLVTAGRLRRASVIGITRSTRGRAPAPDRARARARSRACAVDSRDRARAHASSALGIGRCRSTSTVIAAIAGDIGLPPEVQTRCSSSRASWGLPRTRARGTGRESPMRAIDPRRIPTTWASERRLPNGGSEQRATQDQRHRPTAGEADQPPLTAIEARVLSMRARIQSLYSRPCSRSALPEFRIDVRLEEDDVKS